jgi:hypothetical protein
VGDPHLAAPGRADDELRVAHGGARASKVAGEGFAVGFREQEAAGVDYELGAGAGGGPGAVG